MIKLLLPVLALLTFSAERALGLAGPNIVVIMADDLGYADVGYATEAAIQTPHLDRMASQGVQLTRFYAQPKCAPTRASFLTGAPPGDFSYRSAAIPEATPTLAERFQRAGYQTALVGKWHLGETEESHPQRKGFDHFYGHLGGYVDYYTKEGPNGHDWQRNGLRDQDPEYATTLLGSEAVRVIEQRDPSAPLFLFVSFNAPHFPPQAPEALVRKYQETTLCMIDFSGRRCRYMAQVESLDQEIGAVLDAIESEGIERETLVLFLSDNGGSLDFQARNRPLRGGKLTAFEGGIRVVALAHWPGVLAPGASTDQVIRVQDLWSTFEDAAGLSRESPRSSRSAWRVLRDGSTQRQPVVYATTRPPECYGCDAAEEVQSALIDGDWKLIESYRVNPLGDEVIGEREVSLYNLREDPFEERDLAADEQTRTEELLRRLRKHQWHGERWANEPISCRPASDRRAQRRWRPFRPLE